MNFIGVDLHKKSITVCVMDGKRANGIGENSFGHAEQRRLSNCSPAVPPTASVRRSQATASYLWFVELVAPGRKVALANPKKLRVIAESTKKTDRLDAQVLTEFLVLDMIPESYQPTPRQRQHRGRKRDGSDIAKSVEGSGTGPILLSQATFLLAHIANNGPVPLSRVLTDPSRFPASRFLRSREEIWEHWSEGSPA